MANPVEEIFLGQVENADSLEELTSDEGVDEVYRGGSEGMFFVGKCGPDDETRQSRQVGVFTEQRLVGGEAPIGIGQIPGPLREGITAPERQPARFRSFLPVYQSPVLSGRQTETQRRKLQEGFRPAELPLRTYRA